KITPISRPDSRKMLNLGYQVTQHKDNKIINDPNEWSDNPRYIIELLQKVVTVSMRTVEIVSALPELDISE
ncbi:MAG: hypothetical protein OXI88_04665, partial [Gammaproteobacteria bacterium]|nr:hypothetical protein [Gammaproteobacteria bacterium]MDE0511056.1 hypothetical protein [Gammaproteobacteria bacterium]